MKHGLVNDGPGSNETASKRTAKFGHARKMTPIGVELRRRRPVAALTNTAGGLIILGTQEDDHARTTGVAYIAVSDAEANRMLTIFSYRRAIL
jgi:hypothetical protein